MEPGQVQRLVEDARVGRLGTVSPDGRPHQVPCCFVLIDEVVYTAVDAKPKSTLAPARVRNITTNRVASLLVDHYEEDWSALWWVRLDGAGRVVERNEEMTTARVALVAKYPQYSRVAIPGPVLAIDVDRWTSWP